VINSPSIIKPEEFFGFKIGEDRKLARWDKIVEYFKHLSSASNRILVEELGKTTEGQPFIVAFISSPENLSRLEEIRNISCKLSNPDRTFTEAELKELIENGKVVVVITNSMHATEVGGTQSSVELAYRLVSSDDSEILNILENVIVILIPSQNPDGQVMVVDWYNKTLGTEYEGTPPPWLYHRYCGHDNNRDAYMLNLPESSFIAKIVYKDWCPQIYVDHHQMGSYGARLFISPEMDPIYPEVDPILWRETQFVGSYVTVWLERAGIAGVETGAPFTPDFISAFQTIAQYMNIIGILTESASVKIATPIYVDPHQLKGYSRGRLADKPYMNYPNPWKGGWWRLSDIVKQQIESSLAILTLAAKHKGELLKNSYLKALRSIIKGRENQPYAFLIPNEQHDPLTALKLIDLLLKLGVKVFKATQQVKVGVATYDAGCFIIPLSQPRRALIRKLLERFLYPDDETTRDRDGKPLRPYDIATDTVSEFMGVNVIRVDEPLENVMVEPIAYVSLPEVKLNENARGYLLDPRLNDTYAVVNKLLSLGIQVYRLFDKVSVNGAKLPEGAFYIEKTNEALHALREVAKPLGVQPISVTESLNANVREVTVAKVGIYQRFYGGNMEEGWIRFLLDRYGFPYISVKDDLVKSGKISEELDVLLFPNDLLPYITGENIEEELSKRLARPVKLPPWPPEFKSGIGKEGLDKVREFVEKGGTLVTMGESVELAIKALNLPVRDLTEDLKDPKQYFCPGSTLKILVDTKHRLGLGMPAQALAMFVDKPILEVIPSYLNEKFKVVARFPEKDILQSGWLIGENFLSRKPAVLEAEVNKGKAVMYAIRPVFRAQTHGTFKLLFNALYKYKS